MGNSFMARAAELYFRLQPKPTEARYDRSLAALREKPQPLSPPPRGMACRTEDRPGGRVFWLNEEGKGPYTVFYLHGGSYIHDFSYFHWRFLKKLIRRTDAAVAAPAYTLAPWGTWREAFELILPRFTAYAAAHPDRKLILMGDSAGGGLAAAVALELKRTGARLPDELILLSPWMDVTISDPAIDAFIPQDPWLTPAHRACGRWWAGELDPRDPRVSPGYGDWTGMDHVTIFAGTREILNPDSVKLYEKLDREGANELVVREGMFHVYPLLPVPEAGPAVDRIVEIIRREAPKA